jgi:hypothetical protein
MTKYLLPATIMALLGAPITASAADTEHQADVAKRGADVMPFSLKATTHIFTSPISSRLTLKMSTGLRTGKH